MSEVLCLLLAITGVVVIWSKNNFMLIATFSLFSFLAAALYFISYAPDIALAEVAIGCVFIPLIYIIAIMRQNTFTILFTGDGVEKRYCPPEILIEFMGKIEVFCEPLKLSVKVLAKDIDYVPSVKGIFRPGNIDLLVAYDENAKKMIVEYNENNINMATLETTLASLSYVEFKRMEEVFYED